MWTIALAFALASPAGAEDLICEDISGFTPNPSVNYATQIQPLFDELNCTICHGGNGGLDLDESVSFDNLVCTEAETNIAEPGEVRVEPGSPENSWLYLRVACEDPVDSGFKMPRGDESFHLTKPELRLIADWIAQGAQPTADFVFDTSFEQGPGCN